MLLFYQLFLFLFRLGSRLVSIRNPKARAWIRGRKNLLAKIKETIAGSKGNIIWVHCASLGEFEQGRPLLEQLRITYPEQKLLLTFFSPSGYEIRKNYPGVDFVSYLPMDSAYNARRFLDIVQPRAAIFIKYEFWYYYLMELGKRHIPTLLVSGIFRPSQPFFRSYGGFWRKMLQQFSILFVQNQTSVTLLENIGLGDKTVLAGDTRFDTVTHIASNFQPVPGIEAFCKEHPVLVAGSTWIEDEEVLDHFANTHPELKLILAPHEIFEPHLKEIEGLFKHTVRYSTYLADPSSASENNVLIIDNIGLLSRLYHYADITYVGGGFGTDGLHNILEAAVYARPVVIGPFFSKFQEAIDLVELGGAASVVSAIELEKLLDDWLNHPGEIEGRGELAARYVKEKAGATQKIMKYIQENLRFTS